LDCRGRHVSFVSSAVALTHQFELRTTVVPRHDIKSESRKLFSAYGALVLRIRTFLASKTGRDIHSCDLIFECACLVQLVGDQIVFRSKESHCDQHESRPGAHECWVKAMNASNLRHSTQQTRAERVAGTQSCNWCLGHCWCAALVVHYMSSGCVPTCWHRRACMSASPRPEFPLDYRPFTCTETSPVP
jgi:hypothetical protein